MENPLSRLTRADIPIILPKEFSFPHSRDVTIVPKRIFMNNPQSAQAIADLPDEDLLSQLDPDVLPRHIAIIMDGNGRWAKRQGLPRMAGHREGLTSLRQVLDTCYELDIPILTIYAFSQENWNRPEQEIDILMALLEEFLHQERQTFQDRQMRFLPIGRLQALPPSAQALVHEIEAETKHFTKQVLCVALSYGGRSEIIDAINHLIQDVQAQRVSFTRFLKKTGIALSRKSIYSWPCLKNFYIKSVRRSKTVRCVFCQSVACRRYLPQPKHWFMRSRRKRNTLPSRYSAWH